MKRNGVAEMWECASVQCAGLAHLRACTLRVQETGVHNCECEGVCKEAESRACECTGVQRVLLHGGVCV